MPTASDEVRAVWHNEQAGYDAGAFAFLEARGWSDDGHFYLNPPRTPHVISPQEYDAVEYLCDEWDYGYNP